MAAATRWIKIPDSLDPRKILCRLDPERQVIEVSRGNRKGEVDLAHYLDLHRRRVDSASPQ